MNASFGRINWLVNIMYLTSLARQNEKADSKDSILKKKESYCGAAITFQLEEIKLCIFKICRVSNLQLILNFESIRFNISPAIIG